MAKSTKQWVCQPCSYFVLHTHQQLELNRWQLLALLTPSTVCIPDWIVSCWEQVWTVMSRYLPLRFRRVQMFATISQSWELINRKVILYNPIICSFVLSYTRNNGEQTLRTLINKEPDDYSFPGTTSGSFYIFVFQAVAHVFKLYGIGSLLQLFSDSAYLHLIPNRIQSMIAWTKRHVPIFVDPLTSVGFRFVIQSNPFCVTNRYLTISTLIQLDWGIYKVKNSRR